MVAIMPAHRKLRLRNIMRTCWATEWEAVSKFPSSKRMQLWYTLEHEWTLKTARQGKEHMLHDRPPQRYLETLYAQTQRTQYLPGDRKKRGSYCSMSREPLWGTVETPENEKGWRLLGHSTCVREALNAAKNKLTNWTQFSKVKYKWSINMK